VHPVWCPLSSVCSGVQSTQSSSHSLAYAIHLSDVTLMCHQTCSVPLCRTDFFMFCVSSLVLCLGILHELNKSSISLLISCFEVLISVVTSFPLSKSTLYHKHFSPNGYVDHQTPKPLIKRFEVPFYLQLPFFCES
jgi:hypothetical protein